MRQPGAVASFPSTMRASAVHHSSGRPVLLLTPLLQSGRPPPSHLRPRIEWRNRSPADGPCRCRRGRICGSLPLGKMAARDLLHHQLRPRRPTVRRWLSSAPVRRGRQGPWSSGRVVCSDGHSRASTPAARTGRRRVLAGTVSQPDS
jgi:hypothetical protein